MIFLPPSVNAESRLGLPLLDLSVKPVRTSPKKRRRLSPEEAAALAAQEALDAELQRTDARQVRLMQEQYTSADAEGLAMETLKDQVRGRGAGVRGRDRQSARRSASTTSPTRRSLGATARGSPERGGGRRGRAPGSAARLRGAGRDTPGGVVVVPSRRKGVAAPVPAAEAAAASRAADPAGSVGRAAALATPGYEGRTTYSRRSRGGRVASPRRTPRRRGDAARRMQALQQPTAPTLTPLGISRPATATSVRHPVNTRVSGSGYGQVARAAQRRGRAARPRPHTAGATRPRAKITRVPGDRELYDMPSFAAYQHRVPLVEDAGAEKARRADAKERKLSSAYGRRRGVKATVKQRMPAGHSLSPPRKERNADVRRAYSSHVPLPQEPRRRRRSQHAGGDGAETVVLSRLYRDAMSRLGTAKDRARARAIRDAAARARVAKRVAARQGARPAASRGEAAPDARDVWWSSSESEGDGGDASDDDVSVELNEADLIADKTPAWRPRSAPSDRSHKWRVKARRPASAGPTSHSSTPPRSTGARGGTDTRRQPRRAPATRAKARPRNGRARPYSADARVWDVRRGDHDRVSRAAAPDDVVSRAVGRGSVLDTVGGRARRRRAAREGSRKRAQATGGVGLVKTRPGVRPTSAPPRRDEHEEQARGRSHSRPSSATVFVKHSDGREEVLGAAESPIVALGGPASAGVDVLAAAPAPALARPASASARLGQQRAGAPRGRGGALARAETMQGGVRGVDAGRRGAPRAGKPHEWHSVAEQAVVLPHERVAEDAERERREAAARGDPPDGAAEPFSEAWMKQRMLHGTATAYSLHGQPQHEQDVASAGSYRGSAAVAGATGDGNTAVSVRGHGSAQPLDDVDEVDDAALDGMSPRTVPVESGGDDEPHAEDAATSAVIAARDTPPQQSPKHGSRESESRTAADADATAGSGVRRPARSRATSVEGGSPAAGLDMSAVREPLSRALAALSRSHAATRRDTWRHWRKLPPLPPQARVRHRRLRSVAVGVRLAEPVVHLLRRRRMRRAWTLWVLSPLRAAKRSALLDKEADMLLDAASSDEDDVVPARATASGAPPSPDASSSNGTPHLRGQVRVLRHVMRALVAGGAASGAAAGEATRGHSLTEEQKRAIRAPPVHRPGAKRTGRHITVTKDDARAVIIEDAALLRAARREPSGLVRRHSIAPLGKNDLVVITSQRGRAPHSKPAARGAPQPGSLGAIILKTKVGELTPGTAHAAVPAALRRRRSMEGDAPSWHAARGGRLAGGLGRSTRPRAERRRRVASAATPLLQADGGALPRLRGDVSFRVRGGGARIDAGEDTVAAAAEHARDARLASAQPRGHFGAHAPRQAPRRHSFTMGQPPPPRERPSPAVIEASRKRRLSQEGAALGIDPRLLGPDAFQPRPAQRRASFAGVGAPMRVERRKSFVRPMVLDADGHHLRPAPPEGLPTSVQRFIANQVSGRRVPQLGSPAGDGDVVVDEDESLSTARSDTTSDLGGSARSFGSTSRPSSAHSRHGGRRPARPMSTGRARPTSAGRHRRAAANVDVAVGAVTDADAGNMPRTGTLAELLGTAGASGTVAVAVAESSRPSSAGSHGSRRPHSAGRTRRRAAHDDGRGGVSPPRRHSRSPPAAARQRRGSARRGTPHSGDGSPPSSPVSVSRRWSLGDAEVAPPPPSAPPSDELSPSQAESLRQARADKWSMDNAGAQRATPPQEQDAADDAAAGGTSAAGDATDNGSEAPGVAAGNGSTVVDAATVAAPVTRSVRQRPQTARPRRRSTHDAVVEDARARRASTHSAAAPRVAVDGSVAKPGGDGRSGDDEAEQVASRRRASLVGSQGGAAPSSVRGGPPASPGKEPTTTRPRPSGPPPDTVKGNAGLRSTGE